jgi:hypothetical protein
MSFFRETDKLPHRIYGLYQLGSRGGMLAENILNNYRPPEYPQMQLKFDILSLCSLLTSFQCQYKLVYLNISLN